MLRRQNIGTLLILGLVAEVAAFIAVVDWIGAGPAVLLGIGSTLLGFARLRRIGLSSLAGLRARAAGQPPREDGFADGALSTAGAILLILPGFLTDAIGLALMAPTAREWVMGRIGVKTLSPTARRPAGGPRTIDLEAQDWTRLDRGRRP